MDEAQNSTICVMADFGNGPYAWRRGPEESRPRTGGNIADAVRGFQAHYGISQGLQEKFAAWVTQFERDYEHTEFDWARWNEQGVALARRLKGEVGERFLVEYHYPCEDPHRGGEIIDIDR